MVTRMITGQLLAALAVAGLGVSVPALADVGTGQMAACAERGNPLDCVPTKSAANAAEVTYLTELHGQRTEELHLAVSLRARDADFRTRRPF